MGETIHFDTIQDKSIFDFIQNERIQNTREDECGLNETCDRLSFESELGQSVIDKIRILLDQERTQLMYDIQKQRDTLDKQNSIPTFSDLKSFSSKLESQIRELNRKRELESLLSGPKLSKKSSQRLIHTAPVLGFERQDNSDISDLFKEFDLLDKPIPYPTRPKTQIQGIHDIHLKSNENKKLSSSILISPPKMLRNPTKTSPRKPKLTRPLQTAQVFL